MIGNGRFILGTSYCVYATPSRVVASLKMATMVSPLLRLQNEWNLFFLDSEHLLTDYEHFKVSNDPVQLEYISIRPEDAVQAAWNILPYLQDEALVFTLLEIANNFWVMF